MVMVAGSAWQQVVCQDFLWNGLAIKVLVLTRKGNVYYIGPILHQVSNSVLLHDTKHHIIHMSSGRGCSWNLTSPASWQNCSHKSFCIWDTSSQICRCNLSLDINWNIRNIQNVNKNWRLRCLSCTLLCIVHTNLLHTFHLNHKLVCRDSSSYIHNYFCISNLK